MTWRPITRKRWEERTARYAQVKLPDLVPSTEVYFEFWEEETIRRNVTWLLEHLYVPNAEIGASFSRKAEGTAAMAEEPVNWGDLGVTGLEKQGDLWLVTLEEATDGQCPALCEYVRGWLEQWGWKAKVETTW